MIAAERMLAVYRSLQEKNGGTLSFGGSDVVVAGRPGRLASVCSMAIVVILLVVIAVLLLAGSLIGLAFSLLWLTVTGLVIGALGRLVLPGRQVISLPATALIGIAASLLGGILANVFDVGWIIQFFVAVALAAIGITLFMSSEYGRRRA